MRWCHWPGPSRVHSPRHLPWLCTPGLLRGGARGRGWQPFPTSLRRLPWTLEAESNRRNSEVWGASEASKGCRPLPLGHQRLTCAHAHTHTPTRNRGQAALQLSSGHVHSSPVLICFQACFTTGQKSQAGLHSLISDAGTFSQGPSDAGRWTRPQCPLLCNTGLRQLIAEVS